jgi:hypothetical protein
MTFDEMTDEQRLAAGWRPIQRQIGPNEVCGGGDFPIYWLEPLKVIQPESPKLMKTSNRPTQDACDLFSRPADACYIIVQMNKRPTK